MKTIQIWDKKTDINGYPANKYWEENKSFFGNEDVILIMDGDRVTNIEKPSILRNMLNLEGDKTSLEIGQAYLTHLEEQANMVTEEPTTIEELKAQMDDINMLMADLMGGE